MTSLLGNTRKPDVSFYRNGRIDISARVVKALGIERGDVIDVVTDGDEYLLYVVHKGKDVSGAHEAQCYPSNIRRTHNFRCHSKRLSKAVRAAVRTPLECTEVEVVRLAAGDAYASKWLGKMVIPIITRMTL